MEEYEYNIFQNNYKINNERNQSPKKTKKKKRIPGEYSDKYSIKKAENNILILHACKLLKSYYNEKGIKALILDGREMRTTEILLNLKDRLKNLIIVEYNKDTFFEIKNKILNLKNNIKCYNCHINDYIEKYNDSEINVVYFDLMENFFSSEKSHGSDFVINEFLLKSNVNELIFAATFCLRNLDHISYNAQEKKILLCLEKIFLSNEFKEKKLIMNKNMRYKGQNGLNNALMFVLYYLNKIGKEEKDYN